MAVVKREILCLKLLRFVWPVFAVDTRWTAENAEGRWHFYKLLFCAEKHEQIYSQQEVLRTLYLTWDQMCQMHRAGAKCAGKVEKLRSRDTIKTKIMKYHALFHVSWQSFCRRFCYLQDQTELLDGYYLTYATENSSKSQFIMFTNLLLFIQHGSTLVRKLAISLQNVRSKFTLHPYARKLVVGFWANS